MSHLRNLLWRSPAHEQVPSTIPITTALEDRIAPRSLASAIVTALPQFPIEETHVGPESRLAYHFEPRSQAAERFRLLRMRLKEYWNAGKLKKLLITSALANDGKTTVLLNLATALAERGKRSVLVVEADLHRSTIADTLKLRLGQGLTECLTNEALPPLSVIRRIEPLGWHFMPAGEPRRNPTELLQTPALGKLMLKLSTSFDWVLIDSPPVVQLTDPISLQQHADASLLVVRGGRTPREAVDQAIALLGKKNILGVVLNGVEAKAHPYYQYYGGNFSEDD